METEKHQKPKSKSKSKAAPKKAAKAKPKRKIKKFETRVEETINKQEETPIDVNDFMDTDESDDESLLADSEEDEESEDEGDESMDAISSIFNKSPTVVNSFEPDEAANQDLMEDFDIFEYAKKKALAKNDLAKFVIYKDNVRLFDRTGSCSYTELQKKYGGGTYKIVSYYSLIGSAEGGYIRSQTKMLGDLYEEPKAEIHGDVGTQANDLKAILQQFSEVHNQNKQAEVDKLRVTSDAKSSETSMMIQMMQQNMQMQMQMMQMQSKESDKRFEMLITMMNSKSSQNEKPLDFLQLFELMNKSKESGAKEMKVFFTEAKAMAREMMDDRDDGEGSKKESSSDSLIKTLAPVLAAAFSPRPITTEEQIRPQPQVRHVQAQAPLIPHQAKPVNQEGSNQMAKSKVLPTPTIHSKRVKKEEADEKEVVEALPRSKSEGLGQMNIDLAAGDADHEQQDGEDQPEVPPLNPGEKILPDAERASYLEQDDVQYQANEQDGQYIGEVKVTPLQTQVLETIEKDLISGFMSQSPHKEVAKRAYSSLVKSGISADQVLKAFPTEASILDVALHKGLPIELHGHLKEFYANFSAFLRAAISATSGQPARGH